MSHQFFARILGAVTDIDLTDSGARWIIRESERDSIFMAEAEVETLRLGRRLGTSILEHEGERIAVFAGLDGQLSLQLEGLAQRESSPALFQLAALSLDLKPTATTSEVRDVMEGRSNQADDYVGHDLKEIENLFQDLTYWNIDSNYIYTQDIHRLTGAAICKFNFETPLPIEEPLKILFERIFRESDEHLPYSLLLQAVLASFWQTQFVEIYRCIEQLFPAQKVLLLRKKLRSKRKLGDINLFLAESLSWRPHEDSSLMSLVDVCPQDLIDEFFIAFEMDHAAEDYRKSISNRIYRTRNSIVHYRSSDSLVKYSDERWQRINSALLKLADELYKTFGSLYF